MQAHEGEASGSGGLELENTVEDVLQSAAVDIEDINPFLVDDPDDPMSDPEEEEKEEEEEMEEGPSDSMQASVELGSSTTTLRAPAPMAIEAPALIPTSTPSNAPVGGSSHIQNVYSPLQSGQTALENEDDYPDLHTPALTIPTLFLPVPNTDPLGALLSRHVPDPSARPPRDTTGDWHGSDLHTLVMTNSWRALARMARDRIVSSDPHDTEIILNLWYLRLSSLARLRLFNQTQAECENLFSTLATLDPPETREYVMAKLIPFELEVLRARCAYWAGDHVGYLDEVVGLMKRCRYRARNASGAAEEKERVKSMWTERAARMTLIAASQLIEMNDFTAAASLISSLLSASPNPVIRSALARVHLLSGNLGEAELHVDFVRQDPDADVSLKRSNSVLLAAAKGDWLTVERDAEELLGFESERQVETGADVVAANNYAVSLLAQGKVKQAISKLEQILQASPTACTSTEPFLFNLSTLYELRAGLAHHRKRDLLVETAKWSGDGVRVASLKMGA